MVVAGNGLPVCDWGPLWAETPAEELVLSEVCVRGALRCLSCPTCAAAVVTKSDPSISAAQRENYG